jgi:arylsulfatase A-like enzyme
MKNSIIRLVPIIISLCISNTIYSKGSVTIINENEKGSSDKPNIIMIAVDDLNDWIGAFGGNPQMLTPNMDKLADISVVFRNTSCAGPVCCPSRSALLSGLLPSRTGVYGNGNNMLDSKLVQEYATLPEYFSKNGYITISKGKIFHKHTTENGIDHGQWAFDEWEVEDGSSEIIKEKLYSRNEGIINGQVIPDAKYKNSGGTEFAWAPTVAPKEETKDYKTALWFADKLKKEYDKPFFMAVGIAKPHLPWFVPQEYFDKYSTDTLKIPEFRLDDLDDIINKNGEKYASPTPDFLWVNQDKQLFKEAIRAYMAASTYADDCIGVVLDALKKSKYADNTIVILFGDHGWHLGEKLRFRKAELWRESTQTTFMIHTPGMHKKQLCFRNTNLIDIYPTLVDLCNLPERPMIDGESLRPLLINPDAKRHPALTTDNVGSHSVISEEWHYIYRDSKGGVEELYNLIKDPMEWKNLAHSDSKETQEIKKYLQSFIPNVDEPQLPTAGKNNANDSEEFATLKVDYTIKAKRNLSNLK